MRGCERMKQSEQATLLATLKSRFEKHTARHTGVTWSLVEARLEAHPNALQTLRSMEETGGEPDVIGYNKKTGVVTFCDCAAESPKDRRSLCYDRKALDARKENKPRGNVVEMASSIGIELLDEEHYRALQQLGEFDLKTSSWIRTPASIRALGGALFCDRRYGEVFVYHNGAESYYQSRGFRGRVDV